MAISKMTNYKNDMMCGRHPMLAVVLHTAAQWRRREESGAEKRRAEKGARYGNHCRQKVLIEANKARRRWRGAKTRNGPATREVRKACSGHKTFKIFGRACVSTAPLSEKRLRKDVLPALPCSIPSFLPLNASS